MTSTTCLDRGTPEEGGDGAADGLVDGSGDGFAAKGAGGVDGTGWLVACGGTLRDTAPQPERKRAAIHNRAGTALDRENRNFIKPPERPCVPSLGEKLTPRAARQHQRIT